MNISFNLEMLFGVVNYGILDFPLLQCAASMAVSVGSFSDPVGLEGLAHFLGN